MAKSSVRNLPRLSILDRLIDDDPGSQKDPPMEEAQLMRRIQLAVRRDLEDLLNTRYRCTTWPPELEELDNSLINYGIPDFTAASLNAAEEDGILLKSIRAAITLFEPRLTEVRLEKIKNKEYLDRTFRFRIDAVLVIASIRQEVRFDSSLESATGQFEVE
ncbi:MAG: type VI secretion system baseplate subunit TssE [Planctomycetaceae bacterium]